MCLMCKVRDLFKYLFVKDFVVGNNDITKRMWLYQWQSVPTGYRWPFTYAPLRVGEYSFEWDSAGNWVYYVIGHPDHPEVATAIEMDKVEDLRAELEAWSNELNTVQ